MKFQNCILINFEQTDGQAQSNMPLQLFLSWGHKNGLKVSSAGFVYHVKQL